MTDSTPGDTKSTSSTTTEDSSSKTTTAPPDKTTAEDNSKTTATTATPPPEHTTTVIHEEIKVVYADSVFVMFGLLMIFLWILLQCIGPAGWSPIIVDTAAVIACGFFITVLVMPMALSDIESLVAEKGRQSIELLRHPFAVWVFLSVLFMVHSIKSLSESASMPFFFQLIDTAAWSALMLLFLEWAVQKVFMVDILQRLEEFLFGKEPTVDNNTPAKPHHPVEEVFHIENNVFTYDDANIVCQSKGARLATYDEIEKAYQQGAEWCSYGWASDQMAFFPTQPTTWESLQKDPATKHSCGRPGVNGGYIANPSVKFGATCFGKKPPPTPAETLAMKTASTSTNPAGAGAPEDPILQKKLAFWKDNADKLLAIHSFNRNQWSQF
jgi:hypothetical protein